MNNELVILKEMLANVAYGEIVIKMVDSKVVMIEKKEQFKINKGVNKNGR